MSQSRSRSRTLPGALAWLVLALVLQGCSAPLTPEDEVALRAIRTQHAGRFKTDTLDPVYLRVRQEDSGIGDVDAKVLAIYRDFFLAKDGSERKSSNLVYLVFYDAEGRFRYSLYWDPRTRGMVRQEEEPFT